MWYAPFNTLGYLHHQILQFFKKMPLNNFFNPMPIRRYTCYFILVFFILLHFSFPSFQMHCNIYMSLKIFMFLFYYFPTILFSILFLLIVQYTLKISIRPTSSTIIPMHLYILSNLILHKWWMPSSKPINGEGCLISCNELYLIFIFGIVFLCLVWLCVESCCEIKNVLRMFWEKIIIWFVLHVLLSQAKFEPNTCLLRKKASTKTIFF